MNWTFNESFHRSIIFSNIPLTGNYRFADVFQISRGNKTWPLNKEDISSSSPITLEYNSQYYRHFNIINPEMKNEHLIKTQEKFRHIDFKKELFALLSLVGNADFYSANNYYLSNDELGSDYFAPSFITQEEAKPIVLKDNHIFEELIHNGLSIEFPESIDSFFSNYFQLNKLYLDKFRMSLMLFYNSNKIRKYSPSMSYVALISSIENLVDFEVKIANVKFDSCKLCSQPEYKVSRRFKDFMKKYCMNQEPAFNKYLNTVYSKRSDIAHLGKLLYSDYAETEYDIHGENQLNTLKKYVRIALYNWVILNNIN